MTTVPECTCQIPHTYPASRGRAMLKCYSCGRAVAPLPFDGAVEAMTGIAIVSRSQAFDLLRAAAVSRAQGELTDEERAELCTAFDAVERAMLRLLRKVAGRELRIVGRT